MWRGLHSANGKIHGSIPWNENCRKNSEALYDFYEQKGSLLCLAIISYDATIVD